MTDHINDYIVRIFLSPYKIVLRGSSFGISVSGLGPLSTTQESRCAWNNGSLIALSIVLPQFSWVTLSKLLLKMMASSGWMAMWQQIREPQNACISHPPLLLHEALWLNDGQWNAWGKDINLFQLKRRF